MPMSVKAFGAANDILAGRGSVTVDVALAAVAGSAGIVALAKRIKLWDKLDAVEQAEAEALDADAPRGWWRAVQDSLSSTMFLGRHVSWRHGQRDLAHGRSGYSAGLNEQGELVVTTPVLDEESGTLV